MCGLPLLGKESMVWATVYVARSCTGLVLGDGGHDRPVEGLLEALFEGVFPPDVYQTFSCVNQ